MYRVNVYDIIKRIIMGILCENLSFIDKRENHRGSGYTYFIIAAVVVTVVLLNTGYRNIRIDDLYGTSKVTSVTGVINAFRG